MANPIQANQIGNTRVRTIATPAAAVAAPLRLDGLPLDALLAKDVAPGDVDLLVELDEGVGLVDLAGLKRELSEFLGVAVDVVPASTLKAHIRDAVLAGAIPL